MLESIYVCICLINRFLRLGIMDSDDSDEFNILYPKTKNNKKCNSDYWNEAKKERATVSVNICHYLFVLNTQYY